MIQWIDEHGGLGDVVAGALGGILLIIMIAMIMSPFLILLLVVR